MKETNPLVYVLVVALGVLFLGLVVSCSPDDESTVEYELEDASYIVQFRSFHIVCDMPKQLGMARYRTEGDAGYGYAGMLSRYDFQRFCVPAYKKLKWIKEAIR